MQNKTVFVSGHFNVIHPGHLRLLRFAKECGNRLVVAVESDRIAADAAHVARRVDVPVRRVDRDRVPVVPKVHLAIRVERPADRERAREPVGSGHV